MVSARVRVGALVPLKDARAVLGTTDLLGGALSDWQRRARDVFARTRQL